MVYSKTCKHCQKEGKIGHIKEVKSRGKVAVRAGVNWFWQRCEKYFNFHGNRWEISKDDWVCPKFQALVGTWVVKSSSKLTNNGSEDHESQTCSSNLHENIVDASDNEFEVNESVNRMQLPSTVGDNNLEVPSAESQPSTEPSNKSQTSAIHYVKANYSETESPPSKKIKLDSINTVPYTHSCCLICGHKGRDSTKCVIETARRSLWIYHDVYLPKGCRMCKSHICDDVLNDEAILEVEAKAKVGVKVTPSEIIQWIQWLTKKLRMRKKTLDFDDPDTDSGAYKDILGVEKDEFDTLFEYIRTHVFESCNRSARNALAIFLAKLRLGVSQVVLARLFGIERQSTVSDIIHRIVDLLSEHFVPKHLGVNHVNRELLFEEHNPSYVRRLFEVVGSSLAFVLDGTYIYIQKSADFDLQSRTFSPHKHRNLTKFMMVTMPDGYIIDATGPYFADSKNNDASILAHMLDEKSSPIIHSFAQTGDHLLLDRGFRDVTNELDTRGIKYSHPEFLPKDRKAFTTSEANKSRKVTLVRWEVEAVNGRVKNKFDFFDNIVPNSYLPIIGKMFRIACAILNRFSPPIFVEDKRHDRILKQVEHRMEMINSMQERVRQYNLDRRVKWKPGTAKDFEDFPKLTLDDLQEITLGIYQINVGKWYTFRHLLKNPLYDVFVHKEEKGIIRVKLQSRFRRAMTHTLWIQYENDSEKTAAENIQGYFCLCQQGARTVGTCAHIASVLHYLGIERYNNNAVRRQRKCIDLLDAAERSVQKENDIAEIESGAAETDEC